MALALVISVLVAVALILATAYWFRARGAGATQPPAITKKLPAVRLSEPIPRDEVHKHASPQDLWLILDGKVYDFTSYVDEHPGGDAILNDAGGDASEGFHGPQHSVGVANLVIANMSYPLFLSHLFFSISFQSPRTLPFL
uniref:Cytochrome b5 heme-binding domain-containing protein n=1 Tax=Compsopogon caeruleus TaxID=31354 RepID=A0A7S1X979_9RHOD|mmetsp:Transcript_10433/g.21025  ORF Transcript_10433/g.21025 Transcript_10433/m.21025 type:complete len:141 (+) Transcript_10433:304-726(+)